MRGSLVFIFIFALSKGNVDIPTVLTEMYDSVTNSVEPKEPVSANPSFATQVDNDYDARPTPPLPPRVDHDYYDHTRLCPGVELLASKYNAKTYTASTSDNISSPTKEFDLEISKTDSLTMKVFLEIYKQLNYIDIEGCYGDSKCVYFGDCCPYKDQYLLTKTYNSYKCVPIRTDYSLVNHYLLVAKCLPYFKSDAATKEKCEQNSSDEHPPVISNGVGRFYRNEFCAKCNDDWNFTKWTKEIAVNKLNWFDEITLIRNLSDVVEFMNNYIENIIFKVPFGMDHPWDCDSEYAYIDTCNITGELPIIEPWKEFGCRSHTDPVGYYRNVFCKICNEQGSCDNAPGGGGFGKESFGVLMDLESLRKYEDYLKEEEKKLLCQSEEFYDYPNVRPVPFLLTLKHPLWNNVQSILCSLLAISIFL